MQIRNTALNVAASAGSRRSLTDAATSAPSLSYRPDIDGLRGVAVLLVILYHFSLAGLSGGFLGVDVFFVISGYLITSILLATSGSLSDVMSFYGRRIKRLAPMLLVVLTTTAVVAATILLPDDFVHFLKSLRDALSQRSNLFYSHEAADYFGRSAKELPLLHTWSLSIEWQFYAVFPLVLLIARRFLRPVLMGLFIGALALIAAGLSIWIANKDGNSAYFSSGARAVEFLFGSLVCFLPRQERYSLAGEAIATCASLALAGLAFFFTAQTAFPGAPAVLVAAVAALVLYFGRHSRLLASRGLVSIGKISYSAYLWHWPVVAFAAYLQLHMTAASSIAAVLAVLLVSWQTYIYVETPARRAKTKTWKVWCLLFILPPIVASGLVAVAKRHSGFPERLGPEMAHAYNNVEPFIRREKQSACHGIDTPNIEDCAIGDRSSPTLAIMIGDSHARHYGPFVDLLAREAHVKVYLFTQSECLALPNTGGMLRGREYPECAEVVRRAYGMLAEKHYSYMLLGQRWIGYGAPEVAHLRDAVKAIEAAGARPVILGPVPEDGRNLRDCFYHHIKLRQRYDGGCDIDPKNPFIKQGKEYVQSLFDDLQVAYPTTIVVDPKRVFCDAVRCMAVADGTPLYDDTHHINGFASNLLAERYLRIAGNPLRTTPLTHSTGAPK